MMQTDGPATVLDAEDAKLVTLARGARGRAAAVEGAAVRDEDGRTYAAATVELPSLRLTALQAAVVGAATSLDPSSSAAASDLGTPVVILAAADGTVRSRSKV